METCVPQAVNNLICNKRLKQIQWGDSGYTVIVRAPHKHTFEYILKRADTQNHPHNLRRAGRPNDLALCVCEGVKVCFELGRGEAEDELTMAANNYRSVA